MSAMTVKKDIIDKMPSIKYDIKSLIIINSI